MSELETELKQFFKENNKLVAVSGLIGSGKTKLTKFLENKAGIRALYESVDTPLLKKFYDDKRTYSFPLQMELLNRRTIDYESAKHLPGSWVFDRSIYEDPLVFAKSLFDLGYLGIRDYANYLREFHIKECELDKLDLLIHLDISVDNAFKNISKRNREMEVNKDIEGNSGVSKEYLSHLNDYYERYLSNLSNNGWEPSNVLTLNKDEIDFVNNNSDKNYILSRVADVFL